MMNRNTGNMKNTQIATHQLVPCLSKEETGNNGKTHRLSPYGVFTLAWSGTGTGTRTGTCIMQNLSHCTGTRKNGLYGFNKNLSHCTWTGTGKNTSIHHRAHFQDLKNGYQTHSSGPENIPGVLPCPCSGAVWKVLIKTIQPILPGPCPCPGPGSGPSQCEYTIRLKLAA